MSKWDSKEFTNEYALAYYYKKRGELVESLGGECTKCGSKESLEFDHIDRSKKTLEFKTIVTKRFTPEIKKELKNCQLLCDSCHKEKTSKEKSGWCHGTVFGFMKKKCKCDLCESKKKEFNVKRNSIRRKKVESANSAT